MKTSIQLHKELKDNRVKNILKHGNCFYYYEVIETEQKHFIELGQTSRNFYRVYFNGQNYTYKSFAAFEKKVLYFINKYNLQ